MARKERLAVNPLPWVFGSSVVVEFVRGLVQPDVGRRLAVFSFVTPVLLDSGPMASVSPRHSTIEVRWRLA